MKKILALVLFLCAAFTLTACGGKGIAGEWQFESMTAGEETYKVGDELYEGVSLTADYIVFTFEKDGTGKAVMTMGDESEEQSFEWEEDGDAWAVYVVEDGERDDDKMTATLEDGKLVLSMGDGEYSMSYTLVRK